MRQILLLFCCLYIGVSIAQSQAISFSEPFEEPENLATKIVLCKNRNTLLFNFTKSDGVSVNVFDASHKQVAQAENISDVLNRSNYYSVQVRGIYEIGDNVVAFLQLNGKKEFPMLYRIAFSPVTGKVVSEDRTAIVPDELQSQRRASKYTDVAQEYVVKKDPESDAYAIACYFSSDLDGASMPIVFHYNGKHEEIGRAVISTPGNRYTFSYYGDMLVRGTDDVWICTKPFNNGKGEIKRESSAIMLTRLHGKDTASAIVYNWNARKIADVALRYNPKDDALHILTLVLMSTNLAGSWGAAAQTTVNTYSSSIAAFDAHTLSLKYNKGLDYSGATRFRNMHYDVRNPYSGLPMDLLINSDGSTTVLSEEDGSLPSHDLAIVDYDAQGQATNGYCIRRGNVSRYGFNALANQRNGTQTLGHAAAGWADPGYFAYDYVQTPVARYVFFNDHPANFARDAEKTPKFLTGVSEANTVCYKLSGSDITKSYLFGEPDKTFDNRFADFMSAYYNREQNKYAVLVIEKNGRKKQARIAWTDFQ